MKSILREFARGNINPNERYFQRNNEYAKTVKALSDTEKKLLAVLNEDDKPLLEAFSDAQTNVSSLNGDDKFIYGYTLGALFASEIMENKEKILTQTVIGGNNND